MRLINADALIERLKEHKEKYPASSEIDKLVHDAKCDFTIEYLEDAAENESINVDVDNV